MLRNQIWDTTAISNHLERTRPLAFLKTDLGGLTSVSRYGAWLQQVFTNPVLLDQTLAKPDFLWCEWTNDND